MKGSIHIQSNSSKGETIFRTKRIEMRLTQKEIANKAGISTPQYSRIESGDRELNSASFMTAGKILRAFDMDIEEYFNKELEKINGGIKSLKKIEITDYSDWLPYEGFAEGSGRSEKLWLQSAEGEIGLFKFPKIDPETSEITTEYVSEHLAHQI